jgi:serine/threonine protein kinase/tetratricopeptide (TPR) repeat protein
MATGIGSETPDEVAKNIFLSALEIASTQERVAFLDRRCGSNTPLRAEVETLLHHQGQMGDYLERPAVDPDSTCDPGLTPRPVTEGPGTVIGPYKLLEQIGEGGMGVVYLAEQTKPVRRKLALKIIKPGMDTRQVVARFEAERQALALMDHPNIAQVHDAGATDCGRPYFVMELVKGIPITDYCDANRLAIDQRLELLVLVCHAVQHAHQKGIIHRDIKPSNILVTLIDGGAVPKIIDFGVAKAMGQQLTEKTLFTGFAQLVGTPLYMSPEQVAFCGVDVDTRSDIYSVGVLLYELLTGTTPFDAEIFRTQGFDEFQRLIREQEPRKPSTRIPVASPGGAKDGSPFSTLDSTSTTSPSGIATISANRQTDPRRLRKALRGELDWIVMKCLEKDRIRRYETVNALARDLQRHLAGDPVEAGPPSAAYRLQKFARKHRPAFVTAGLFAGMLLAMSAVSTWQAFRATQAERRATDAASRALRAEAQTRSQRDRALNAEAQARAEAEKAKAINAFLTEDLLTQAEPANTAAEDHVTLLEVLDRAASKVGDRFAGQPEVEDALRRTIAETYHGLASWEKAERQWRAVLEATRRRLGPESPETLRALRDLAHILRHRGRFDPEVLAMAKSASEGLARVLGPDHRDTLASRQLLAAAYWSAGRTDEAIKLDEAILPLYESKLGPDHPVTLTVRNSLASAYWSAGRIDEAIKLHETTLKLDASKLGPDHLVTLTVRNNLAVAYWSAGRTDEAIAMHEATLKLRKSKQGPDHPDTLMSRNNLAEAYHTAGRTAEAIAMHEMNLKARESKLGPDDPDTLTTMNNLARAYQAVGRLTDALPLFESALKRSKAKLGSDHPITLLIMSNLGGGYLEASRWTEAERTASACLDVRKRKPSDDWRRYHTMSQLGAALAGQTKYAEAEPLLLEGYEGLKARAAKIPASRQNAVPEAAARIVKLYEAWGKKDWADRWRKVLKAIPRNSTQTR